MKEREKESVRVSKSEKERETDRDFLVEIDAYDLIIFSPEIF